jgi:hypothetical protein
MNRHYLNTTPQQAAGNMTPKRLKNRKRNPTTLLRVRPVLDFSVHIIFLFFNDALPAEKLGRYFYVYEARYTFK